MTTTTTESLGDKRVHLRRGVPAAHLERFIVKTLHRKGAEGAEAGVIAEMERLLEHHIQHLFETARDYAVLANRSVPNAVDALQAHGDTSHPAKRLKRESTRRRRAMQLPLRDEAPETTLSDTISSLTEAIQNMPQGTDGEMIPGDKERTLEYAFQGVPKLPPSWTYPSPPQTMEDKTVIKVTSAALNFVKATVAEADIDPELGVVDYRSRGKKARR